MSAPSRNDPCPCGSGKKYKKCCLAGAATTQNAQGQTAKPGSPDFNPTNVQLPSEPLLKAVALHQAGHLDEAKAAYQSLLKDNPEDSDALHYLGLIAFQRGEYPDAAGLIEQAIKLNGNIPAFHFNLGNAYRKLKQLGSAADAYLEAIRLDPRFLKAHLSLGNTYKEQGKLEAAAGSYRKALALKPDLAEAHYNLGLVLQAQGKPEAAVEHYCKALALRPDYAEAHHSLGNTLREEGRLDEALVSYRKALVLRPDYAEAYNNIGVALLAQGNLDAAVEHYHKALALRPEYTEARTGLGVALQAQGKVAAAAACFKQAQFLEPDHFEWQLRALGVQLPFLADSRSQISTLRSNFADDTERLLAQDGSVHKLENAQFSLFSLAYHGADDRLLMEQTARMLRTKMPALTRPPPQPSSPKSDDGRIRVGFLSSLLCDHTMGAFTQGYIRKLDRNRFHVTVIHAPGGKNDEMRDAINGMADAVLQLPSQFEPAQQQVADLALDVLHYPDIGMSSYTYFLAYARLAPVQTVSWGHPVTTGLGSIDYFLSFGAAELEDAENHYTETLVRLNRAPTYYEFFVMPTQIAPRSALGLPDSGRLYGCPQTLFKFHPDFDAVLADIIARDPQGWIIAVEGRMTHLRDQLRERWAAHFPALLERVVFLPKQPLDRFMMLLSHMDVLLDTPHFGSGNTLYESMAYGIPIITWPGGFMRGRLVAGIYRWLGIIDAPIAATLDDYAPLAVAFATDRARREALKQQLIEKAPAIYQDELAVRELETFFEQAVAAARRGEKLSRWSSGLPWPASSATISEVSTS